MANQKIPYKIYLTEEEIPKAWYNVRADMKTDHRPILNPGTLQPIKAEELAPVFCDELVKQELNDTDRFIEIPVPIRDFYKMYRPSPLVRAYCLEEALQTPAKIYYKYEGGNTSGSHKLNSAIAQAFYAKEQGLKGKIEVSVSVSGAEVPVQVRADTERGIAFAEMPKPLFFETLDYEGLSLPMLVFEGITHVIAPDIGLKNHGSLQDTGQDAETFRVIKTLVERKFTSRNEGLPAAIGVMFYDTRSRFLRPAVYVRSIGSLFFESSCGSGSAALGVWLSRELRDGTVAYTLNQPGGVIETEVDKKAGEIRSITIGGELKLGDPMEFLVP